jgi:hypothetical protein
LQTDPIRFDAGDINIYRYCGNDPIDWNDPSGEFTPCDAVQLGNDLMVLGGLLSLLGVPEAGGPIIAIGAGSYAAGRVFGGH